MNQIGIGQNQRKKIEKVRSDLGRNKRREWVNVKSSSLNYLPLHNDDCGSVGLSRSG